jgi:hypothetical protein
MRRSIPRRSSRLVSGRCRVIPSEFSLFSSFCMISSRSSMYIIIPLSSLAPSCRNSSVPIEAQPLTIPQLRRRVHPSSRPAPSRPLGHPRNLVDEIPRLCLPHLHLPALALRLGRAHSREEGRGKVGRGRKVEKIYEGDERHGALACGAGQGQGCVGVLRC